MLGVTHYRLRHTDSPMNITIWIHDNNIAGPLRIRPLLRSELRMR